MGHYSADSLEGRGCISRLASGWLQRRGALETDPEEIQSQIQIQFLQFENECDYIWIVSSNAKAAK